MSYTPLKEGVFNSHQTFSNPTVCCLLEAHFKEIHSKDPLKSKGQASIFMRLTLRQPTQSCTNISKNHGIYIAAECQQSTPDQQDPQFCIRSNLFRLLVQLLKYLIAEVFRQYSEGHNPPTPPPHHPVTVRMVPTAPGLCPAPHRAVLI